MLGTIQTFFTKEECEEIVSFCEKVGIKPIHKIDARNKWDYLRIHNDEFIERINSGEFD